MSPGDTPNHENGTAGIMIEGGLLRMKTVATWCCEPVSQSGQDAVRTPNCRPLRGSTQSRLLISRRPPEAGRLGGSTMDAIYKSVAGLDVHKKTVVACVRRLDDKGRAQ